MPRMKQQRREPTTMWPETVVEWCVLLMILGLALALFV
jgi:hypothetical protein